MPIRRRLASRKRGNTVKTELRALDLLEWFDRVGRECKVGEIAATLGYPQSSASRLLFELSDAGYLSYDRWKRTYRPSVRTALIGAQTLRRKFPRMPFAMLEELGRLSATPVILTGRNERELSVLHTGQDPTETCFHVGDKSALVGATSGQVILAHHDDRFINTLLRRYNTDARTPAMRIQPDSFFDRIARARRQGYLVQPLDAAVRQLGSRCRCAGKEACALNCCLAHTGPHLAAPIPSADGEDMAAIVGIPADLDESRHESFAAEVKDIISRCTSAPVAA